MPVITTIQKYLKKIFFLALVIICAREATAQYELSCNRYLVRFDGSRSYITAEYPSISSSSMTAALWMRKEAALPANPMGLIYRAHQFFCYFGLVITPAGELKFEANVDQTPRNAPYSNTNNYPIGVPSKKDSLVTSGLGLSDGRFYHIAFTYDDKSLLCNIYVNGEVKASKTLSGQIRTTFNYANNPVYSIGTIMQWYNNDYIFGAHFKGYIDEVFVANKVLGKPQIDSIALKMVPESFFYDHNIGAYWSLEEGSGPTSINVSPIEYSSNTDDNAYLYYAPWINYTCPNKTPVANAGADQTITLPIDFTTLDGSASKDPDGNIVSYGWVKVSGPGNPAIVNPSLPKTNVTELQEGNYVFQLTVKDDKGETATASVKIKVLKPIPSLIVDAGKDTVILLPANIAMLNGVASENSSKIARIKWTKIEGPNDGVVVAPNLLETKVESLAKGDYLFQLEVKNYSNETASDQVRVKVMDIPVAIYDPMPAGVLEDWSPGPEYILWRKFRDFYPNMDLRPADGAVADGLTRLILVFDIDTTLILQLAKGEGLISPIDNDDVTARKDRIELSPMKGRVFAIYYAPDGFENNSGEVQSKAIKLSLEIKGIHLLKKETTIRLHQPPVLLVHGEWGQNKDWNGEYSYYSHLRGKGFNAYTFDGSIFGAFTSRLYRNNSFKDGEIWTSTWGLALEKTIEKIKADLQEERIASTQVDVVAHAAGGLHMRTFINKYLDVDNHYSPRYLYYNSNPVHKLITLGTPHLGSPIGPVLEFGYQGLSKLNPLKYLPYPSKQIINLFKNAYLPIPGDYHRDISPQGKAIKEMPKVNVKVHTISGDYKASGNKQFEVWNELISFLSHVPPVRLPGIKDVDDFNLFLENKGKGLKDLYQGQANDVFVTIKSAIGNLTNKKHFDVFVDVVNSEVVNYASPFNKIPTLTNSIKVRDRISTLLLSNDPNDFANYLPRPDHAGRMSRQLSDSLDNFNIHFFDSTFIAIDTTQLKSIYNAVETEPVRIGLTLHNGAKLNGAFLFVEKIGILEIPNDAGFKLNFNIPKTIPSGMLHMVALGFADSGMVYADTTSIIVQHNLKIDSFSIYPDRINLDSSLRQVPVDIIGFVTDNGQVQPFDLTYYFQTYKNVSTVFEISKDGLIKAKSKGTDSLIILIDGIKKTIPVNVSPSFNQRAYYANQIFFPSIEDIELQLMPVTLKAKAISGEDVHFAVINGPIFIQDNLVFFSGAGKATVQASSKGNAYFLDAPSITRTFCINPLQPTSILGDSITCPAQKSYPFKQDSLTNYTWSVTGGSVVKQTKDSITINWTNTGLQKLEVKPDVDGCFGEVRTMTVTVTAPPATPVITASGPTTICEGSSVGLKANVTSNEYKWFRSDTVINVAISQTFTATKAGSYRVEVSNGKCAALSAPIVVAVTPMPSKPVITISGSLSICEGSSAELKASTAANSYKWFNNGTVINDATSQSYKAIKAGSYKVEASNGNCTALSDPVDIVVTPLPATPVITTTGSSTFCEGGNVILNSEGTGMQWYKNGSAINGANDVKYTASQSGKYTVSTTANGCTSISGEKEVLVNPLPLTPVITAGGPLTFCTGSNVVLTSSSLNNNQWYKDGALINGATNQLHTANAAGNYVVKVTTPEGCSASSAQATVVVNSSGIIPVITATGATHFCEGESVVLSSSVAATYQWYKNNAIIITAKDQKYTVSSSGNYSVKITDVLGCTGTSKEIQVAVTAIPTKPRIAKVSDYLQSNIAVGNQWFVDGTLITGATTPQYNPGKTGNYTVQIIQNGCKSPISDTYHYIDVAPDSLSLEEVIGVYPNPFTNNLTITSRRSTLLWIELYDITGKEILFKELFTGTFELSLSYLRAGVYIAVVTDGLKEKRIRRLLVKL